MTHNYVLVETTALVHRRLGPAAVRELHENLIAPIEIVWIGEEMHARAVSALLAGARRRVSLVDWVSFELMRARRVETAFAFDRDFAVQGFELIP